MQARRWHPDQPTRIGRHDWPDEGDNGTHMRLRAGSIVVLDRQAWRILEIDSYTGDRWPDIYEKAWRDHVELWWHANELRRANNQAGKPAPERAEFYKRPVVLVLRNENLPRSTPKHWCAPASHDWEVLPEHYAVCRACGELPPCRHGEYRWEGGPRWPEQNGGIPLMVPEGCCMGCAEPIRPRVRTVRFPGPNLWYPPLGEDTAVFHARAACADQVDCYRMQWQTEYNPRPAAHSTTPAFPGFEQFVLPRTRNAPDLGPHAERISRSTHPGPVAPSRPVEEECVSVTGDSGVFHVPFDRYRGEARTGAMPAAPPAPTASEPTSAAPGVPAAPGATPFPGAPALSGARPLSGARSLSGVRSVSDAPAADPIAAGRPAAPHQPPAAEATVPAPSSPAEEAGQALQAAEKLVSLAGRPAFHNAEQAARVIEELTAAVRNIALCLHDPAAGART
ncbi:hypothetical protein ACF09K_10685 [Streptomyces sp. NPDC014882]|uniref:hypothetical protein n=1 Tax=Streptomyces sp. NPDC014882 TaxID=3364927 RepID=UPI0037001649